MNNTIAAIATPYAVGGVSIIRISGKEAFLISKKVFLPIGRKKIDTMKGYQATFGSIVNSETNEVIDEGILTKFIAPNSYTGEDVVEISCHGGLFITQKVLALVLDAGAELALAGEFTKRAFLNGKMDLNKAEAISELITATNNQSVKMAMSQLDGRLTKNIMSIKDEIVNIISHLAVWADYPDDEYEEFDDEVITNRLEKLKVKLDKLIDNFYTGCIIREGINTAIVGKPNVGKSTIMNLLSKKEKSIVSDIPGTTRDVVEDVVRIGDITLNLADTAGIRQTKDVIEGFGVDRSFERINTAQLILFVVDYSEEISKEDVNIIDSINQNHETPVIVIVNKSDLEQKIELERLDEIKKFEHKIFLSAKNTEDADVLKEAIYDIFSINEFDTSTGVILNERQRRAVVECRNSIETSLDLMNNSMTYDALTVVLEEGLESVLSLFGQTVSQSVVDEIFSKFCVGK